MDYSNESFEMFQKHLRSSIGEQALQFLIRDSLFVEAYYGKKASTDFLHHLPFGWFLVLLIRWAKDRSKARHFPLPAKAQPTHHFLYLSPRNNHIHRMNHLLDEHRNTSNCAVWIAQEGVAHQVDYTHVSLACNIQGHWTRHFRWRDVRKARQLLTSYTNALNDPLDRRQTGSTLNFLIQFLAWGRFWRHRIPHDAELIACTFEKSAITKSMFHTGWKQKVPKRIHWIHGLRHASMQSTFATDLLCMTPGDARYLSNRTPTFCTPRTARNPDADRLIETAGTVDSQALHGLAPIHFLFLGPGLESSYTHDMRMADLEVLRTCQKQYGERILWRFRPHPSASKRFREELVNAGIQIDEFSSDTLHQDLRWAHMVGSSWSSLLLDIRETGRPIFWIQSQIHKLGAVDELIEDGIGIHLGSDTGYSRLDEFIA